MTGLMFYDQPPLCQISLENMEKLAIERLRFLRLIEKAGSVHGGKYWSEVNIQDLPSKQYSGRRFQFHLTCTMSASFIRHLNVSELIRRLKKESF